MSVTAVVLMGTFAAPAAVASAGKNVRRLSPAEVHTEPSGDVYTCTTKPTKIRKNSYPHNVAYNFYGHMDKTLILGDFVMKFS